MTDYSAHDIHRLDQAYPDALADIEAFTGDPKQKARLADKGTEVYAAELTRELADTATSPMSLAAWAAIATVRLMEAGRVWEEDTDAAWAKVDKLTAELTEIADAVAPTVTVKPTTDAVRFLHQLYKSWVKTAHERQDKVDELTAALTQSRAQAATYANEIGTLKAHNSRLRTKLAERGLPDDADHWVNFNGVCEDDCPECAALKATRAEATR